METIIAAAISAIGALIIALVGVGPQLGALKDKIEDHDNQMDTRVGILREDHKQLTEGCKTLDGSIKAAQTTLTFLKEAQIRDEARRESLQAQVPDAQKMMDTLQATFLRLAELERQLQEARATIQALQEATTRLKKENAKRGPAAHRHGQPVDTGPEQEDDWDLEP